jgi:hypothetical protein
LEVNNCTYYYNILSNPNIEVADSSKKTIKKGKYKNISEIKFHKNDSITLKDNFEYLYSSNLKYANGVKIKTGTYFPEGTIIGILSGALIGATIGAMGDASTSHQGFMGEMGSVIIPIGAGIGAAFGFLTGSIIGTSIEKTVYIDLKKFKEAQRRDELLKFIKKSQ